MHDDSDWFVERMWNTYFNKWIKMWFCANDFRSWSIATQKKKLRVTAGHCPFYLPTVIEWFSNRKTNYRMWCRLAHNLCLSLSLLCCCRFLWNTNIISMIFWTSSSDWYGKKKKSCITFLFALSRLRTKTIDLEIYHELRLYCT